MMKYLVYFSAAMFVNKKKSVLLLIVFILNMPTAGMKGGSQSKLRFKVMKEFTTVRTVCSKCTKAALKKHKTKKDASTVTFLYVINDFR